MILGYVSFVLSFLLPGICLVTLLGLHRGRGLLEWITLSAGVGLAFEPLLLAVFNVLQIGVQRNVVLAIIVVSGLLLILLLRLRGLPSFKVERSNLAVVVIWSVHLIVLASYFYKYPIFPPEFHANDYVYYVNSSLKLVEGSMSATTARPMAVNLLIATGITSIEEIPLIVMRWLMLFVASIFPLAVFILASKILKNIKASIFTTAVYAFGSPLWIEGIHLAGLYANLLADLLSIFAVYILIENMEKLSYSRIIYLFVVGIGLVNTHSSVVVFLLVIWLATPLVGILRRSQLKRYLVSLLVFSIPIGVLALFFSDLVARLVEAGTVPFMFVRHVAVEPLAFSPFLMHLRDYANYPTLFFVLVALIYGVLIGGWRKDLWALVVAVWFVTPWMLSLASFQPVLVWRSAFYSLLPAIFVIGLGYDGLFGPIERYLGRLRGYEGLRRIRGAAFAIVILLGTVMLVQSSALGYTVGELTFLREFEVEKQRSVLESMVWLEGNIPKGSRVMSVGLQWYYFLPSITGISHVGEDVFNPDEAFRSVSEVNADYLALFALLQNSTHKYVDLYDSSPYFTRLWSNEFVVIYRVRD